MQLFFVEMIVIENPFEIIISCPPGVFTAGALVQGETPAVSKPEHHLDVFYSPASFPRRDSLLALCVGRGPGGGIVRTIFNTSSTLGTL